MDETRRPEEVARESNVRRVLLLTTSVPRMSGNACAQSDMTVTGGSAQRPNAAQLSVRRRVPRRVASAIACALIAAACGSSSSEVTTLTLSGALNSSVGATASASCTLMSSISATGTELDLLVFIRGPQSGSDPSYLVTITLGGSGGVFTYPPPSGKNVSVDLFTKESGIGSSPLYASGTSTHPSIGSGALTVSDPSGKAGTFSLDLSPVSGGGASGTVHISGAWSTPSCTDG